MSILYIECNMGAAGDMLTAALSELLPDSDEFIREINALKLPHVEVAREYKTSCGIRGAHIHVRYKGIEEVQGDSKYAEGNEENGLVERHGHDHDVNHDPYGHDPHDHDHGHHAHGHHAHGHDGHAHSHAHFTLADIQNLVNSLNVSDRVKSDTLAVYDIIARAESRVHGRPVEEIHFHEVGAMDAIVDVLSVCLLIEKLNPDKIIASPIALGYGQIKCAHGIMPVPAPATAEILRGIPCYAGNIRGELCTPTGAALLKYFASEFIQMPIMTTDRIGIGIGTKEFPAANILRAFIG